jgi:hypothetical protein
MPAGPMIDRPMTKLPISRAKAAVRAVMRWLSGLCAYASLDHHRSSMNRICLLVQPNICVLLLICLLTNLSAAVQYRFRNGVEHGGRNQNLPELKHIFDRARLEKFAGDTKAVWAGFRQRTLSRRRVK